MGERPDDPALAEHHQTAGAKLVALRRQLPQLYSPRELRTCAGELDLTEWHIECAEALAEGRGLPPQPSSDRPALCFFTHEHGLGTVEVDVTRPDGTVASIWVCPANAVALSRAEPLLVGAVHVGGRQVPWPTAPTYYGAAGWSPEDLPGLEYEGREIWGRETPQRDEPVDVPPDAVPGVPVETMLPPGRRDAAAAGRDRAADRRGRPAARRVRAGAAARDRRSRPPTAAVRRPARRTAPRCSRSSTTPPRPRSCAPRRKRRSRPTTRRSIPTRPRRTIPFAATDDELPPWETDEPTKRD